MEGQLTGSPTDAYGSKETDVIPMPFYSNSFSNGPVSPFRLKGF